MRLIDRLFGRRRRPKTFNPSPELVAALATAASGGKSQTVRPAAEAPPEAVASYLDGVERARKRASGRVFEIAYPDARLAAELIRDALNGEVDEFRHVAGFASPVSRSVITGRESFTVEIGGQTFRVTVEAWPDDA